jgi:hypothetical protein
MILGFALLGCAAMGEGKNSGTGGRVEKGTWGGTHVMLEVEDSGGRVEFDCAHGVLEEPLVLDRDNHFDVAGHYVREHSGPVRKDEDQTGVPARYRGHVENKQMSLEVAIQGQSDTQSFSLALGSEPRVMKCR